MATKTFYATKDMKDPLYRTRMLKAGEPLELSGPNARLYLHLGVVTAEKPARAAPIAPAEAETVTKPKRAPRKRKKK